MHSPEFEFEDWYHNLDLNKYKFRIIGWIRLTGMSGDIDMIMSKGPKLMIDDEDLNDGYAPIGTSGSEGFNKKIHTKNNYSARGYKLLCSGHFYRDSFNTKNGSKVSVINENSSKRETITFSNSRETIISYHVHPFQVQGSIVGKNNDEDERSVL
jgi:hypothetical protein